MTRVRQSRLDVDYGDEREGFGGIDVARMAGVALGYQSRDELPSWEAATRLEEIERIAVRSTEDAICRAVPAAPDVPAPYPPDVDFRMRHLGDDRDDGPEQTTLVERWPA